MKKKMCPLISYQYSGGNALLMMGSIGYCKREECAWYCPDSGVCAVVKIQEELIKLMGD